MNEFLLNNPWVILAAMVLAGAATIMAATLAVFWFGYLITYPFRTKDYR
jgi:hypothetical protein